MGITADIVVIGGGVNGCSIALQLARRGVKNVVLVEKGHIASGPTGRSSGIIRQHYTIETLACMARDSVRVFQHFAEQVGGDAGFVQCGGVFLCPEGAGTALRETVAMHRRLGIRESIVSADELRALEPQLDQEGIALAAWEPDAGYADPALTANSFAEAARKLGVRILKRTEVTGIRKENGRIAGVTTNSEEISTRTVINAAGPWGGRIAALVGRDIPIFVTRHAVVILQRPSVWRSPTHFFADLVEGWYYKPERGTALMVGSLQNSGADEAVDPETYAANPEFAEVERYSEAALKRFPVMEEGMAQGGWAGVYDMTPDGQPVLDAHPDADGLYCAAGFSGHGFKLSPAIGIAISELVLDGRSGTYDLSPFRFGRFQEGRLTSTGYRYSIIG